MALLLVLFGVEKAAADELSTQLAIKTQHVAGNVYEGTIPLTIFRPFGQGPFPAIVLSHGRPESTQRSRMGRVKLSSASTTLLGLGYVVIVPTRTGYGSAGGPDLEFTVSCEAPRYAPALAAAADQIAAAVAFARSQQYVLPEEILLIGHSVGGAATIAAASRGLPGVQAAVAFNSGYGGRSDRPGEPCAPDDLKTAFASYGATQRPAPVLWIHTEDDRVISMEHEKEWFAAFSAAGGSGEFRAFPAQGPDSHYWFSADPAGWRNSVRDFLAKHTGQATP